MRGEVMLTLPLSLLRPPEYTDVHPVRAAI